MVGNLEICTPHQVLFARSDKAEYDDIDIWVILGRGEIHSGCWWGILRESDHLEDVGVGEGIILKWVFKI
jgi:hypothetical protein